MTTYELPPEPEVGARVRDHYGHVWTHTNDGWSHPELRSSGLSWGAVMAYASPAELIEPDPWPTEPLIAAEGRLWFRQEDGDYLDKDGTVRGEGRHTFAGPVVPVTVAPAAALPVLWSALDQWLNNLDTATEDVNRLVGAVINLRDQTDALGLDA